MAQNQTHQNSWILLDGCENSRLRGLELLHEVLSEGRVLDHSLPYHGEAGVAH